MERPAAQTQRIESSRILRRRISRRGAITVIASALGIGLTVACTPGSGLDLASRNGAGSAAEAASGRAADKAVEKEQKQIGALREALATARDLVKMDPETASWLARLNSTPTLYAPSFTVIPDQPLVTTPNRLMTQVLIRPHSEQSHSFSPILAVRTTTNLNGQVVSRTVESTDDPHSGRLIQPIDKSIRGPRTDAERFSLEDEQIEVTEGELIAQARNRTNADLDQAKWRKTPDLSDSLWVDQVQGETLHPLDPSLKIEVIRFASGRQLTTETNLALEDADKPATPTPVPLPPPSASPIPKQEPQPFRPGI